MKALKSSRLKKACERIANGNGAPFVVLTFDDGYRDNMVHALPVLRAARAPFTLYVTTGFADATARLWWVELEEAIRILPRFEIAINGANHVFNCRSDAEKLDSFNRLYWHLRTLPEDEMRIAIAYLAEKAGVDALALTRDLCMRWDEIVEVAADPLCTIGIHTLTHPMLGRHRIEFVRDELARSRRIIEEKIDRQALHLAYPVGDPMSAGMREFDLARQLGFASAVTTRPGMIFPEHAQHLCALPRLSVNGNWQQRAWLEVLLSGAPVRDLEPRSPRECGLRSVRPFAAVAFHPFDQREDRQDPAHAENGVADALYELRSFLQGARLGERHRDERVNDHKGQHGDRANEFFGPAVHAGSRSVSLWTLQAGRDAAPLQALIGKAPRCRLWTRQRAGLMSGGGGSFNCNQPSGQVSPWRDPH
jgi:peptidoglycan/xylan/chitin deacetylase (PgdA/CDA1 family)